MKLRDLVQTLLIPEQKLTQYALNPDNEQGQHKARVFASALGFTQENYRLLLEQIQQQALDAEVTLGMTDRHGRRVRTDLAIIGVNGQQETVRVGWRIPPGSREAHLATLSVRKRR